MREAIGGTWLFGIVITFMVLFSSYLAISVNYSKAFRVKNEIVNIIEKHESHSEEAQGAIKEYNSNVGYGVSSNCGDYGTGYDQVQQIGGGTRSRYCVSCITQNDGSTSGLPRSYYTVTVFFKLDLPIFGNIFVFPVRGETKPLHLICDGG